ncbi:hypothetical protein V2J09_009051 [Rumex salicifolius]
MESSSKKIAVIFLVLFLSLLFLFSLFIFLRRRLRQRSQLDRSIHYDFEGASGLGGSRRAAEELIRFEGAGDLAVADILDAPGEVIGKSPYGTLYEASVVMSSAKSAPEVMVLRFLRPECGSGGLEAVGPAARAIGVVRHANVVPLRALYVGPMGEMLLVHPFYDGGNLAQFLSDNDNAERHKWDVMCKIAHGIAKGLDHLHTGLARPIIHGNLKSKNILLDGSLNPYVSDHGIHLLVNPKAGQEMLEVSALQGYKPPELVKMKDACESTDVYSLGVVLLELLTRKRPIVVTALNTQQQHEYLPDVVRSAVLGHRVADLYHPDLVVNENGGERRQITQECILKLVQLAISCCSPSPSFRPPAKEIVRKIEEIRRFIAFKQPY